MIEVFSILPERLGALSAAAPAYRLLVILIVSVGGGGIGAFFWALPAEQQLDALRLDIQQRESMLQALEPQQPLSSTSVRAALQAQLAMYPVWRSTRSEHDRLSELVDLAGNYQLETLQLRAAPEREASSTLLSPHEIRQLARADVPFEILQHGYRWQLQGSPQGVMTLLDHLTGSAASIDEFSVEGVQLIGDRSSRNNDQGHRKGVMRADLSYTEMPVRLDLAFRHFVVKTEDPWSQTQPDSFLADAEVAERQSQRDWQTIEWAQVGLPDDVGTGRCIPSAMDYLNGLNEDVSHIFADQRIEHVTLVGIVRLPALPDTESGQKRLRAVFLGRRGELLAAEVGSSVAIKGYRLVSVNHQQVVLQGPDVDAPDNHRVLALHSEHAAALSDVQQISAKVTVP
jgi:hypothetical protein